MPTRQSARWSLTQPWIRVGLVLLGCVAIGIFASPWLTRTVGRSAFSMVTRWLPSPRWSVNQSVQQERDALRSQLQAVTQQLLKAERQLETAEALAKLEAFVHDRKLPTIYSQVIGYSPDPGIQTLTVNRGSSDDVRPGSAVVSGQGFLIGVVTRVNTMTATVLLITDPQSQVVAKVRNPAESRGLVQGEQGLSIHMSFIPKHDSLAAGQLVVTSGTDPNIPVDLPIGTVGTITPQQGDLFQSMSVISPVDMTNLDVLAIILNPT